MRFGVLGDMHSNLQAMEVVLADLAEAGVEGYLCLGDVVGYGADPRPVLDAVRQLPNVTVVAGNHDWGVTGQLSLDYFNQAARAAIHWTRQQLTEEEVAWLTDLPLVARVGEDVTLAHGTVHEPQSFDYLQTPYDAYLTFDAMKTKTAFVGHSHIPVTFFHGNPVTYSLEERLELGNRIAVCNVGSVGQPRDEDPRAAYGIYDDEARVLEIRRLAYDVETACQRIIDVGLPPILGERLHAGR